MREQDGNKVLVKTPAQRGLDRSNVYIGPSTMKDYQIQVDLMGTKNKRRLPDMGLIANRYTLDMQGRHQRLQIRSWASDLRMAKTIDFSWETDVWYTMKMMVEIMDDKAIIRGKVWRTGEPEPEAWTITAEDPLPNREGSPGYLRLLPSRYLLRQSKSLVVLYTNTRRNKQNKGVVQLKPLWKSRFIYIIKLALLFTFAVSITSAAEEIALWGGTLSRNMVSDEKNIPASWDLGTGENIKWTAELGSQSYAGPLVIGGKVFVGTNNKALRNPKLTGDRGNIMAFRESDGKFLWQIDPHETHLRVGVNDWPLQGICSTPYVEGDRLYYVSPTVVKSSVWIPKASLMMVKMMVPLPKKPKRARLMATSSGATT